MPEHLARVKALLHKFEIAPQHLNHYWSGRSTARSTMMIAAR
jgi:hypothetical protein